MTQKILTASNPSAEATPPQSVLKMFGGSAFCPPLPLGEGVGFSRRVRGGRLDPGRLITVKLLDRAKRRPLIRRFAAPSPSGRRGQLLHPTFLNTLSGHRHRSPRHLAAPPTRAGESGTRRVGVSRGVGGRRLFLHGCRPDERRRAGRGHHRSRGANSPEDRPRWTLAAYARREAATAERNANL